MLLEDLLRNTPDCHPDFDDVIIALQRMKDVAKNINEKKRISECSVPLIELAEQLESSRQVNYIVVECRIISSSEKYRDVMLH